MYTALIGSIREKALRRQRNNGRVRKLPYISEGNNIPLISIIVDRTC